MKNKICFVLPNLKAGGQERVIAEIANNFAARRSLDVSLVLFTKAVRHYYLNSRIKVYEADYASDSYNKLKTTLKAISFIRQSVRASKPDVIVSFGEKWNSLVLISCLFIKADKYVSDRCRPTMRLSFFQELLRRVLYPFAAGIIAQTELAKQHLERKIKHRNIAVIGNPIRSIAGKGQERQNIILNVGRFVSTKRQALLIEMFADIDTGDWKLMFLGDGHMLDQCKAIAQKRGVAEKVIFAGQVGNTDDYYRMSRIFAFTSNSEGFPNVLGEAQAGGLAVITFDFEAGGRDLVENNVNGFLIPEGDVDGYKAGLLKLMYDSELRESFSRKAVSKIVEFDRRIICNRFYSFLTGTSSGRLTPLVRLQELKLSVIIPVYNVQDYIEKCIYSILDQDLDYNEFEIIVINDGSTDDTLERVVKISEKYRNIRIFDQENSGPSVARNRGIKEARGEYLWFIDGDDWIDKNCFKSLFQTASHNSLDLLWLRSRRVDEANNTYSSFPSKRLSKKVFSGTEFLDKVFSVYCFSTHFLIRRTFLLQTGCTFVKGIIYEDSEFMPRVIMRAERVKYEDITCYNYVKRSSSLISAVDPKKLDYLLYVIASNLKIISTLENPRVKNYYRKLLTHLVIILLKLSSKKNYVNRQKDILAELRSLNIRRLKPAGAVLDRLASMCYSISPALLVSGYNIGRAFKRKSK